MSLHCGHPRLTPRPRSPVHAPDLGLVHAGSYTDVYDCFVCFRGTQLSGAVLHCTPAELPVHNLLGQRGHISGLWVRLLVPHGTVVPLSYGVARAHPQWTPEAP